MKETKYHKLLRAKNDAYVSMLRAREAVKQAEAKFNGAKADLQEHNIQLSIHKLAQG
jgi:hypothetical protein|tara:strand:+ start:274 stop:444 length:171 start_codon:yes stop_codon:yes gene_type:complete